MSFQLPKLNFDYNALEPHFDGRTMEIHHSKHHAGYTNNLNNAIIGTEFESQTIEDLALLELILRRQFNFAVRCTISAAHLCKSHMFEHPVSFRREMR